MPMTSDFAARLDLPKIAAHFGTPFHIYDERGIRQRARRLNAAFDGLAYRNYYAVKALPNPRILQILREEGMGFDCSSVPELMLIQVMQQRGATHTLFTSNNTTPAEFEAAQAAHALLNLDDITLIDTLPHMPERICFRYNPGERRTGNAIIGNPVEAKFGVSHAQIVSAYQLARERGAKRFGLHTMVVSNERDHAYIVATAKMLLDVAAWVGAELGITFDFLNIGGGMGIPYHPDDAPLDLDAAARDIRALFADFEAQHGYRPALYTENGRFVTGAHGVLVTRAINQKNTYRRYVGVDANMSALMRPGMYGAYHHITVAGKTGTDQVVDVVGALCENNDKFAIQRALPPIENGDLLIIHDTGAHGHAMGFNYNGRLRPQELLLRDDGRVERIRRAQRLGDYFATLDFVPDVL